MSSENSKFIDSTQFFTIVDSIVWRDDVSYTDATVIACQENMIDIEEAHSMGIISPILIEKLLVEGVQSGQLKKTNILKFED